MIVSAIVAVGRNGEIGAKGGLPWPWHAADMRWFKANTIRKPIIMGRKTWESLPAEGRPLARRENILLSGSSPPMFSPRNAPHYLARTASEAVEEAALGRFDDTVPGLSRDEAVVIGGARVYGLFRDRISRIYLTRVDGDFPEADTFFPYPLPASEWRETPGGSPAAGLGFFILERAGTPTPGWRWPAEHEP